MKPRSPLARPSVPARTSSAVSISRRRRWMRRSAIERGVDGRGDDEKDEQAHAVIDEVVAKAQFEHDLKDEVDDAHAQERVGDLRHAPAAVPEDEHAEGDVAKRRDGHRHELDDGERHGERDVVALAEELGAVLGERYREQRHEGKDRERGDEAVDAVDLEKDGESCDSLRARAWALWWHVARLGVGARCVHRTPTNATQAPVEAFCSRAPGAGLGRYPASACKASAVPS